MALNTLQCNCLTPLHFRWLTGVYSMCVARIREHVAGGAWCPSEPISKHSSEYLEVDLGRLMVITLVETQGRFDNGQVGTSHLRHFNPFTDDPVKALHFAILV